MVEFGRKLLNSDRRQWSLGDTDLFEEDLEWMRSVEKRLNAVDQLVAVSENAVEVRFREDSVVVLADLAEVLETIGEAAVTSRARHDEDEYSSDDSVGDTSATGSEESHLNGERLKRRGYEADDGAYQFVGWYDTLLEENCTFRETSAGVFHCLGNKIGAQPSWNYSDSSCETRITEFHPAHEGSSQVQVVMYDVVAQRQFYSNWNVIGEVEVSTVYVKTEDGDCIDANFPNNWFISWMEVERVDESAYVAAAEVID